MKRSFKVLLAIGALLGSLILVTSCNSTGLANPTESWDFNQAGTETTINSALKNGTAGAARYTVSLKNNTFGKVLDFSTEHSRVLVENSKIKGNKALSISVWVMAPARLETSRVIIQSGDEQSSSLKTSDGFKLYLDGKNNHELTFEATGLSGTESSGVSLTDGLWHHVLVTVNAGKLNYYIDGSLVKSVNVSGSISIPNSTLHIGCNVSGNEGFDGSIAELRIYNKEVKPEQATNTILNKADNEAQDTYLDIQHGIALDRRQYYQSRPLESEGQTVTENDIINCINMGFDHVKLLLTPNHLIDDDGHLIEEELEYITEVVGYVEKHNYKCIVCLHPEGSFKLIYLKNLDNFETLINWYGEFAQWVGEHWSADTVAIQLMTEPGENNSTVSWSWMSDRMWGAVRNVLPDHTILTSSNAYGNIEYLKYMSPASDSNLVYTFTTYEPYTIGWYYYNVNAGEMTAWSYVHDIPYPIEEGVDYTDAIEYAISDVPDSLKKGIRAQLTAYVNGEYDGKNKNMVNNYDSLYNANWHMLRAKSLDDWRQANGGNIHIMCVEFGCMDNLTPNNLWHNTIPAFGISNETRLQFTKDMRSSFDAYDIGWDYWSYNEAHTIFKTTSHSYGDSPAPEIAKNMFDYDMLTTGLGLTPLVEAGETNDVEIDPSWFVFSTFEGKGSWYGSGLVVQYGDAPSGYSAVYAVAPEKDNTCVIANAWTQAQNISAYSNGYLHVFIYVEDVSKVTGGQLEVCSGGGPDMYETSWNLIKYLVKSGWNELYLPFSEAGKGNKVCDLKNVNFIRLYIQNSEKNKCGVDLMYVTNVKPEGADDFNALDEAVYTISENTSIGKWYGTGLKMSSDKTYITATTRDGAGSAVFACGLTPINIKNYANGTLKLRIYVEDASLLKSGQIELTSSGEPDKEELSWDVAKLKLQTGWNEVELKIAEANKVGGTFNFRSACYMRLYFGLTQNSVIGLGAITLEK